MRFRRLRECFSIFNDRYPALFSGLSLLLGAAIGLQFHWVYCISFLLLCLPQELKRIRWQVLCFACGILLGLCRTPHLTIDKTEGEAYFRISCLKFCDSPFGQRSLVYKGSLDLIGFPHLSKLPCQIYVPLKEPHPTADRDYRLNGTLEQKAPFLFVFKPAKNTPWVPIVNTMSFAERRFLAKQSLNRYLKSQFSDRKTCAFLYALATGDVDERILSLELGKLGLQHILAISGFHFALIALFLRTLLRPLFSYRVSTCLLLLSLTSYWLFLGGSPSIERAWIALFLLLIGSLWGFKSSGLNALGVALFAEILYDPLVITHMGFQLSFLCTLAILLTYPLFLKGMERLLPKRSSSQVLALPLLDQHGYLAVSLLKRSLALNLAVHALSVPLLLHLFHRFPIMSIAYNLFFPFWVSLSLLLLCSGLCLDWIIPPLSEPIHACNALWTRFSLDIAGNPPAYLDFVWRTSDCSLPVVILFLTASVLLSVRVGYHSLHLLRSEKPHGRSAR